MKAILPLASCVFFIPLWVFADADPALPKPPKPRPGPLGMAFVPLPKATFYMGGGEGKTAKKTEIKEAFEIAVHEVTQGQWQELMGDNPSAFSRKGVFKDKVSTISDEDLKQFPVERVKVADVEKFIEKLNEKEAGKDYTYRLPAEAEWEYACRGGATSAEDCSFLFYLAKPGNDLSSREANILGYLPAGKADKGPSLNRPAKVGSYAPNKLGLYDMHGNAREWCSDVFDPKLGGYRVVRGGCWSSRGEYCSARSRSYNLTFAREEFQGFRLVRVAAK